MTTKPEKNELRRVFLRIRQEITMTAPEKISELNDFVSEWLETKKVNCVGFYWAFRGEPPLEVAIRAWLRKDSSRVAALPVIEDPINGVMHYARWCPNDALKKGIFSIETPVKDERVVPEVIFAPCVAFNTLGYRLGNGGGFFDRYFQSARKEGRKPLAVAVAYDALESEKIPKESHDVAFEFIVTESGVRAGSKSNEKK